MSDKNWWFIVDITDYPESEIVGRRVLKESAEKDKKFISRDRDISESMLVLVEAGNMYKAMEDAPKSSKMPREWFESKLSSSDYSNVEKEIENLPDYILYGTSRELEEEKLDVAELTGMEEHKQVSRKQRKNVKQISLEHEGSHKPVQKKVEVPLKKPIILKRGDTGEKIPEPKKITVDDLIRTRKFDPTNPMQMMEYEMAKRNV